MDFLSEDPLRDSDKVVMLGLGSAASRNPGLRASMPLPDGDECDFDKWGERFQSLSSQMVVQGW